jgi:hypothetical protein
MAAKDQWVQIQNANCYDYCSRKKYNLNKNEKPCPLVNTTPVLLRETAAILIRTSTTFISCRHIVDSFPIFQCKCVTIVISTWKLLEVSSNP